LKTIVNKVGELQVSVVEGHVEKVVSLGIEARVETLSSWVDGDSCCKVSSLSRRCEIVILDVIFRSIHSLKK
jgi:hypothetical protein